MVTVFKYLAVLVAAVIVGSSFLDKDRKAKRQGEPWYKPYLSLPGLLILVVLLLPVVVWFLRK